MRKKRQETYLRDGNVDGHGHVKVDDGSISVADVLHYRLGDGCHVQVSILCQLQAKLSLFLALDTCNSSSTLNNAEEEDDRHACETSF